MEVYDGLWTFRAGKIVCKRRIFWPCLLTLEGSELETSFKIRGWKTSVYDNSWSLSQFNENFRILKWRYCTTEGYSFLDFPLHRPYTGLIYGRYPQFRFLKWSLNSLPKSNVGYNFCDKNRQTIWTHSRCCSGLETGLGTTHLKRHMHVNNPVSWSMAQNHCRSKPYHIYHKWVLKY